MFESTGTIHYDDSDGFRVIMAVDQDILAYYHSLIPKGLRVAKPGFPAHVTVVRPKYDTITLHRYWGNHEGERVPFMYDPYQLDGYGYFWLDCWSLRLEAIRSELGLPNTSRLTTRPPGTSKTFHITIGMFT